MDGRLWRRLDEREAATIERRRSERLPTSEEILLEFEGRPAREVRGTLVDISHEGFCARHDSCELRPGQVVCFRRDGFSGRARVMWTRIFRNMIESGFFIVNHT